MKKIVAMLLALSLVMFVGCSNNNQDSANEGSDTIRVAMELAYPPFEMKDDQGNPSGVSVDIANAFGEYLGKEVEIINTPWDGLIPSLETDKADLIISSMSITEERDKQVDFSDPYASSTLGMLVNVNSDVDSIDDFKTGDKKLTVKSGTAGHIYAQENLPAQNIVVLADESACATEVVQGKADGFIYDQLTISRHATANPDETKAVFLPIKDVDPWAIAVKEGNSELQAQINAFLADYKAKGGYQELTDKYLSEEKKTFDQFGFNWFFDLT